MNHRSISWVSVEGIYHYPKDIHILARVILKNSHAMSSPPAPRSQGLLVLIVVAAAVVVAVVVVVVVVVVVGAPRLPTMLVDIVTSRALGGSGGRVGIIAYKPSSTSQSTSPNLMPSSNCSN